jgi:hypothetical protein
MYLTFPYTLNFDIRKTSSNAKYVLCLGFKSFNEKDKNFFIYIYIEKEKINSIGCSFEEYIKKAVNLIELIDSDTSESKTSIFKNDSGLVCGTDYAWSEDLFKTYGKTLLDDEQITEYETYYISNSDLISDPSELTDDEIFNKNPKHFFNLNNYNKRIDSNIFSKDELYNFTSTFFKQIFDLTSFDYQNPIVLSSNKFGALYLSVMTYFLEEKSDATSKNLSLILSSTTTLSSTSSSTSSCGCSSTSSSLDSLATSCSDQYSSAMEEWLMTMMGDLTNYYEVWFYNESVDEEGNVCITPNTDLINQLIELINEFVELGLDLSFASTGTHHHCNCAKNNSSSASDCNYKTINNFVQVLNWILDDDTALHKNTIKSYGKDFGKLLKKLYF